MQAAGTANAPFLLIHLDTAGVHHVQVSYHLRGLDSSADDAVSDNAVSQVALQYGISKTGNFVNFAAGYVADATAQSQATQVTQMQRQRILS